MAQSEQPSYEADWNDLRNRQRAFFIAWLGGFVAVGLLAQIKWFPPWAGAIGWAVAFWYTGNQWSSFACPRCSNPFFKPNGWTVNQFIRVCPHCGLRKYAETDADEEARYLRMNEQ